VIWRAFDKNHSDRTLTLRVSDSATPMRFQFFHLALVRLSSRGEARSRWLLDVVKRRVDRLRTLRMLPYREEWRSNGASSDRRRFVICQSGERAAHSAPDAAR